MPTEIRREDVERLMREGAQLVEVLPTQEYKQAHLAGASNIPLAELGHQAVQQLQPDQSVIVYCHDYQ